MKSWDSQASYYALTLAADRRGKPFWSRHSHWVAWSERNPNWEVRATSLVIPDRMAEVWAVLN
jgi:hypothetical protein